MRPPCPPTPPPSKRAAHQPAGYLLQNVHLFQPLPGGEVKCDFFTCSIASPPQPLSCICECGLWSVGECWGGVQSGKAAHLQQQDVCSTLSFFFSHVDTHIYNSPPLRSLPTSFFSSSSSAPSTLPSTPSHPHSVAHLAIAAPPPHRNQFKPAAPHRHGMLAKGDGALSGSPLQPPALHLPPPSRPPSLRPPPSLVTAFSLCFSTFPQHAWCVSRAARRHDRAALLTICGSFFAHDVTF